MITFLIRSALGRAIIVLIILVAVAAPIGYFAWRAKTQSSEQFLGNAREQQNAGKREQAKVAYDRAVNASKDPREKQEVLRKIADSYREAEASSPLEALENYTAAIAAESKILRDTPADAVASENTLDYYTGMLNAFGPGAINLESAIYLSKEKLKTDTANLKAANLLVKSQILLWRRQGQTTPSRTVIEQRLQPATFCLNTSLRSCAELVQYLHASISEDETQKENKVYAAELTTAFTGSKPATKFVHTVHDFLTNSDDKAKQRAIVQQASEEAIGLAPSIMDPKTATSWSNFISGDRSLSWDQTGMQARGDTAALTFAKALPDATRNHPDFQTTFARLLWRLGTPDTNQTLDTILEQPLALRAEAASLTSWSRALEAATIKVDHIIGSNQTENEKSQQLKALSDKFAGSFGGESVSDRIAIAQALVNQWHFSAGSDLLENAKLGDQNAWFWAAASLRAAGAPNLAYQLSQSILLRAPQMRLPGRYVWKLMESMALFELQNARPDLATKRLADIAGDDKTFNPATEAYLAAQLIELIVQARRGRSTEALEQLELLTPQLNASGFKESPTLRATLAALLAETGDAANAVAILVQIPLSPTVIAVWPGMDGGHAHAWSQLKLRLAKELEAHHNNAIRKVAKQILSRSDSSRAELLALHQTATRTSQNNQAQLLALQIALGHMAEAEEIIQDAKRQNPQPAWLPGYELSMAIRRGDWPQVLAGLENPAIADRIDPVQKAYVEAAALTRQGKQEAALAIVNAQLEICDFHQDLWMLKGQLAESSENLPDAKQHYSKAAALNPQSPGPMRALYRVLRRLGEHTQAVQLLAAQQAKSGNLTQLAGTGDISADDLAKALEAQRSTGTISPNLQIQLMALQWRAGRKSDAQATAAGILKQYPDRLAIMLPALGYRSDPEAVKAIANFRANAKRPLVASELIAVSQFWRLRGYANREKELLQEAAKDSSSPVAVHRLAGWHTRAGQTETAAALLETEWRHRPTLATGLQLAEVAVSNKDRKRALVVLDKLTEEHHGLARINLLRAFLLYPQQPHVSVAAATSHIQNQPQDPWGWYYRARMQWDDPEAAPRIPKDLKKALELTPEMEQARMMLADWMLKHGDAVGASKLLESGGLYSPGSLKLGIAEVVAKIRDMDEQGACRRAESLLEQFPRVALTQRLAMFTFLKFGRYYRALPLAEQFLADAPDSVIELNNVAHLLAVTGEDPERGHELIAKAISAVKNDSPYRPYLEDTRTVALVSAGRHADAISKTAALHGPHQPVHCLYLAVACSNIDRLDDAKKLIAKAQQADTKHMQGEEWYLALADLSIHIPTDLGNALLPIYETAASNVEEQTGGGAEIPARIYAALGAAQIAAGKERAAVIATLRRSSSYQENPWAAVLRASIVSQDGDPAKTAAAVSQARELLADNPCPVLAKKLVAIESHTK